MTNDPYKCCTKMHSKQVTHENAYTYYYTKCGDVTEDDKNSQRIETALASE